MQDPRALVLATVMMWAVGQTIARYMSLTSPWLLLCASLSLALAVTVAHTKLWRREIRATAWRTFDKRFVVFGALGFPVSEYALIQCYRSYDKVAEPVVLNYSFPLFVVIFTELFFRRNERRSPGVYAMEAAGITLCVGAMATMVTGGSPLSLQIDNVPGLLWGVLAAASYALFSSYSGTLDKQRQSVFLIVALATGVLAMLPAAIAGIEDVGKLGWTGAAVVLYSGIVSNGLASMAWAWANRTAKERSISITAVSSLMYVLPVLSIAISSLVYRDDTLLQPYFVTVLTMLLLGSAMCQLAPWAMAGAPTVPGAIPRLELPGVTLRAWQPGDVDALWSIVGRADVMRDWVDAPENAGWSRERTADYIQAAMDSWRENDYGPWAVEVHRNGQPALAGWCGLDAVDYLPIQASVRLTSRLLPEHYEDGVAAVAGTAAADWAFRRLSLESVVATVNVYAAERWEPILQGITGGVMYETLKPYTSPLSGRSTVFAVARITRKQWQSQRIPRAREAAARRWLPSRASEKANDGGTMSYATAGAVSP